MKVANKLRESVRFAHSSAADVGDKFGQSDAVVLFRPKILHNKFEVGQVTYEGDADMHQFEKFIKSN